jgi:hypothetical protein
MKSRIWTSLRRCRYERAGMTKGNVKRVAKKSEGKGQSYLLGGDSHGVRIVGMIESRNPVTVTSGESVRPGYLRQGLATQYGVGEQSKGQGGGD